MSALIHIVAWLVKKPSMARHAGSYFVLSMCDRLWHPDMSEDEALALMEKGIAEVTGCTGAVFAPMCFGAAKRCVCFALCIRSMVSHHYVRCNLHYWSFVFVGIRAVSAAHTPRSCAQVKARLVVAPPSYVIKVCCVLPRMQFHGPYQHALRYR